MEAVLTGLISIIVGYSGFELNMFESIKLFDPSSAPLCTLFGLFMTGSISGLISMLITSNSVLYIIAGSLFVGIVTMIIGILLFVGNAMLHTQILHERFYSFEITLCVAYFLMGYLSHSLYQYGFYQKN